MAMTICLLLSLLTVQIVTGQGLRQRDFKDARDRLRAELEHLVPKQLSEGTHGHDVEYLQFLQMAFPPLL